MKLLEAGSHERSGKSYLDVMSFKKQFALANDQILASAERLASVYNSQPPRTECKLCASRLDAVRDFENHGIDFFICPTCGHVNGGHDDSAEFHTMLYSNSGYAQGYIQPDALYVKRLDAIYAPKARFLLSSLEEDGADVSSMKFLDVGAGAGYFVAALERYGANAEGIEPNGSVVEFANTKLSRARLSRVDIEDSRGVVARTDADVVSFIGVLEHVRDLRGMLDAVVNNEHISYMYFSVPMFSMTVLIESVFDEVFSRQLSGVHNHVFSNDSLEWMYARYGMRKVSAWTFGADVPDLFRALSVMLSKKGASERVRAYLQRCATASCDKMQEVIDSIGAASETHVLADLRASR